MKNEKGFSLIVLVVTIIVLIILTAITLTSSDDIVDDAVNTKDDANAVIDNEKIEEILIYEYAGTYELIDVEIDLKRVQLSDDLQIEYDDEVYGHNCVLYLAEEDIDKAEQATGNTDYYKAYKDLTKSYIVDSNTEKYIRLEKEWKFK